MSRLEDVRWETRMAVAAGDPRAHAKITQAPRPMTIDQIEVGAALLLFRMGHGNGARMRESWECRHVLHWLGVALEAAP